MIEDLKNAIQRYEAIDKEFEECLQSNGKKGDWDDIRKRANLTHDQIENIYKEIQSQSKKWQTEEKQAKLLLTIKNIDL